MNWNEPNKADIEQLKVPELGFNGGLFHSWLIPVGLAAKLWTELNWILWVLIFEWSELQVSETALYF